MNRPRAALTALCVAFLFAACDDAPSPDALLAYIEQQAPSASFRRDSHLRLGRFTLALARGVARLVEPGDRETHLVLSNVRRVEISTWEVDGLPPLDGLRIPPRLEKRLEDAGWVAMLQARDEESRTWVYYREDSGGTIRNLYVVELDAVELTVIDLAGSLDRVVAELVADDPDGFVADLGA